MSQQSHVYLRRFDGPAVDLWVNSQAEPATPSSNASAAPLMVLEERFRTVRSVGEECIQLDELMALLTKKPQIVRWTRVL
ncbi:hypothetical protein MLD38_011170 [Melastoma candidum]|uniref:Uncharacterized protein n=1 Tax=Melastoma candidum TaxID=119954 RepID=A0ACB9R2Q4_9MYRT|nr:hypothetical protein MLD38_011170 [Melastoma candidum]